MNVEEIVLLVTQEVMKRLGGIEEDHQVNASKKILIADCYQDTYKNLEELLSIKGFSVDYMQDDYSKLEISAIEYVVVPNLTNNTLTKVALGIVEDQVTALLSDAFFCGKQVTVLEEGIQYRKYKAIASSPYLELFKNYEAQMVQFGASIVKEEDLVAVLEGVPTCSCVMDKKVITEMDINKVYEKGHGEITMSKESIISPLASDYVRTHGIRIKRI